MSQCWAQNNTGREGLRAMFRASLLDPLVISGCAVASRGWAIGLRPCNFMLDLSCQRPQSLSIPIPSCSFNRFASKTFFRYFSCIFLHFSSRVSQSFNQLHNLYLQDPSPIIYPYPQCGFCITDSLITKPIKASNPP
jgi:hypothetical protein